MANLKMKKTLLLLMVGISWIVIAPEALAIPVELSFAGNGNGARLELRFSEPVKVEWTASEREVLLQFDRAIEVPPYKAPNPEADEWIAWLSAGFDTVLIHSPRSVGYRVSVNKLIVTIEMVAGPEAAPTPDERARVTVLEARLLQAQGKPADAAELIAAEMRRTPDEPQLLTTLADLQRQRNQWRRAEALYSKAYQLQPRNEDVFEARRKILLERSPVTRFGTEHRTIGKDRSELISSMETEWRSRSPLSFRMIIDQDNVLRGGSNFVSRRAEFSTRYEFENGGALQGAIHNNTRDWGGSMSYVANGGSGVTRIDADYSRPFWETAELLAGYGSRDRLAVSRAGRLGPRLSVHGGASASRYRIDHNVEVRTWGLDGGMTLSVLRSDSSIDLEYLLDVERNTAPLSEKLPFASREVHAAGVLFGQRLGKDGRLSGASGITFDRTTSSYGPYAAGRFAHEIRRRLAVEMWFERRQNSISTQHAVTRVGVQVALRFPGREAK